MNAKLKTRGLVVRGPKSKLTPFEFNRRLPGANDVVIRILYCGICHSDLHQVRNEWKSSSYPMVPGHEIAGMVTAVGPRVSRFKAGDLAGIGCFVDSCRTCSSCKDGEEQFCENHISWTYNGTLQDKKTKTFGGYSTQIVVDENYVLKISKDLPIYKAAPLLCAGITTYSPLKHFKVGKGSRVGVVGLGGLGHMAVKLAASMGAEVSVISRSGKKARDARRFGAKNYLATKKPGVLKKYQNYFDFILDTASAYHSLDEMLNLVKRDGVMCLVGAPEKPAELPAFSLIVKRRKLAGSLIGGITETQEMLDYCSKKKITPEVEVLPARQVNKAYARMAKGDVHYRFVLDMTTL